jgi:auxin influx carrier (AUX1 LAX family)
LLGPYWKAAGLAFNCTFLLFGSVIQLIACARSVDCFFFLVLRCC